MSGLGPVSVFTAKITVQMLMQREVMSRMLVIDPVRVIAVLVFVL